MSIDSILGALDRARSETSFDESGDIDSTNYDIDCGQGGDELVEGQASQSINRVEVRGKNYTKNRRNRRRRALKKACTSPSLSKQGRYYVSCGLERGSENQCLLTHHNLLQSS